LVETAAALPPRTGRQHARGAATGLFVTFLWSTSWVLIKVGLDGLALAPLSFAGLRYALAAVVVVCPSRLWPCGGAAPQPRHRTGRCSVASRSTGWCS
jgi:drug/metabolite transporter (DMT)-like permease